MTAADLSLGVLAVAALALIGVLVRRPEAAATLGGRVAAFAALFVLPGLVLLGGAARHYEQAQTTTFCLSCHGMAPYGESLYIDDPRFLPAAHFQNRRVPVDRACYTCHTNYTMFGGVDDKVRGVRHVWHAVWGTVSDPVELYEPFENRACLATAAYSSVPSTSPSSAGRASATILQRAMCRVTVPASTSRTRGYWPSSHAANPGGLGATDSTYPVGPGFSDSAQRHGRSGVPAASADG